MVSGGLAEPVTEFAIRLGIDAENVHAVETRHDSLSSSWWNGNGDQDYLGVEDSPLARTDGKAEVIRQLLSGKDGGSILIGDGLTDAMAADEVDVFVGFGGVVHRPEVEALAEIFVAAAGLHAILPLAVGTSGADALRDGPWDDALRRGLEDVEDGLVTFRDEVRATRFREAFGLAPATMQEEVMDRPTVLVSDPLGEAGSELLAAAPDVTVRVATGLAKPDLLEAVRDVEALIVRSGTQVDAEVIEAAPRLRIVGRAGVGTDNIDVDAATKRGVLVTNTPHANTTATAELTMALMLAAARHIGPAHGIVAAGQWERSGFTGFELKGKTLGIVGFGRIGRAVAARARAFEMRVVAYDPYVSEAVGREHGVALEDLDGVLAEADVLTLHAVPPPDGSPVIGAAEISRMKPGASIVNAARGQLLDAAAARAALDDGHLRVVGVDVYAEEPPPADHPLVGHPKVVHTPHLGASTVEAQRDVSVQIVEQVLASLRGQRVENCVNLPFAFDVETEAQLKVATAMGRLQSVMADAAITRVEVDVSNGSDDLVTTVAAGFLAGLVNDGSEATVNYVNAPSIAHDRGIAVSQGHGIGMLDYPNLISCRVSWNGGGRTMSGVVFGGKEPRIVQISDYHVDAKPEGTVLLMLNQDLPGVIGEVGTLLGSYEVNIAEWRLGRNEAGGLALSFINLDAMPDTSVLDALRQVPAVTKAEVVEL